MPGNLFDVQFYFECMGDDTNYFTSSPSVVPHQIDLDTEYSPNSSSSEQESQSRFPIGKAEEVFASSDAPDFVQRADTEKPRKYFLYQKFTLAKVISKCIAKALEYYNGNANFKQIEDVILRKYGPIFTKKQINNSLTRNRKLFAFIPSSGKPNSKQGVWTLLNHKQPSSILVRRKPPELRSLVRDALKECGGKANATEIFDMIEAKYPNQFHKDSVFRVLQQNTSIFLKSDQTRRNSYWVLVENNENTSLQQNSSDLDSGESINDASLVSGLLQLRNLTE